MFASERPRNFRRRPLLINRRSKRFNLAEICAQFSSENSQISASLESSPLSRTPSSSFV